MSAPASLPTRRAHFSRNRRLSLAEPSRMKGKGENDVVASLRSGAKSSRVSDSRIIILLPLAFEFFSFNLTFLCQASMRASKLGSGPLPLIADHRSVHW
jgi:hypothetical protein